MSTRTYLYLYKKDKEVSSHQLLGRSDFFSSLESYFKSIDIVPDSNGDFGYFIDPETDDFIDTPCSIPDLKGFISAIDAVVKEMLKNSVPQFVKAFPGEPELDSVEFPTVSLCDFTTSYFYYNDKHVVELKDHMPLALLYFMSMDSSYISTTYRLIEWLDENHALIETELKLDKYSKPKLKEGYSIKIQRF